MQLFLALRPHFYAALAMFMLVAYMAVEQSSFVRGLLIAPILVLFFAAIVFYGLEYDAFAKTGAQKALGEKEIKGAGSH